MPRIRRDAKLTNRRRHAALPTKEQPFKAAGRATVIGAEEVTAADINGREEATILGTKGGTVEVTTTTGTKGGTVEVMTTTGTKGGTEEVIVTKIGMKEVMTTTGIKGGTEEVMTTTGTKGGTEEVLTVKTKGGTEEVLATKGSKGSRDHRGEGSHRSKLQGRIEGGDTQKYGENKRQRIRRRNTSLL